MRETPVAQERNKQVVAQFWQALYAHDWDKVGSFFTAEANYADAGTGESGGGAHGPEQIVARLRLGLEPAESHTHEPGLVVAEGSVVVTEHLEVWSFHTGEVIRHPFASVMELDEDGLISRWWDYSNMSNLLDNAPQWWIEHIASGWRSTVVAGSAAG